MKANELRIGNLFSYNGYEYKCSVITEEKIESWQKSKDGSSFNAYEFKPIELEPIPLTEDWLVKMGFNNLGYGEFELGNYIADGEYTDKGEYEFCYLGKRICTVYFVHQLQNLYFALTGEELKINFGW